MDAPAPWLSIAPPLGARNAALAPHDDDDDDAFLAAQFRRSVDCDDDSDASDAATPDRRPLPPALPLPALDAADAALWNLISPCSDASEPPDFDGLPLEQQDEEQEEDHPEPEASPRATVSSSIDQCVIKPVFVEEDEDVRYASSSDSEDEEVEVFNAAAEFPPLDGSDVVRRRSSSLDSDKPRDDALDSVTEGDECFDELDVLSSSASSSQLFVDDSASEDGAIGSHGGHSSTASSSSSSARASLAWVGRVKARTYSGPRTLQLHGAIDKLRARTRSATATLRHAASTGSVTAAAASGHEDDDGGFSSDDEDFDHARASRVPTPTTRATSLSFPTRLSAVKNLQGLQLPTTVASMMRFRSSSSATMSSEDSFIGSHGSFQDSTLGSDMSVGDAPSKPTVSSAYNRQELKHKASACATRAAGLLGAASAEAARKLRTMRTSSSAASLAATSPVVDREESSPGRPPLPARAASRSTSS